MSISEETIRGMVESTLKSSGVVAQRTQPTGSDGPTKLSWTTPSDFKGIVDLTLRVACTVVKEVTGGATRALLLTSSPSGALKSDLVLDFGSPASATYMSFMRKVEPNFPDLSPSDVDEPTGAALSALLGLYASAYENVTVVTDFIGGMVQGGPGSRLDVVTRNCHFCSTTLLENKTATMILNYRHITALCENMVDADIVEKCIPSWGKAQTLGLDKYKEMIEETDNNLRDFDPFSEKACHYLLSHIAADIIKYCTEVLFDGTEVWQSNASTCKRVLENCIDLCQDWKRRSDSVLSISWSHIAHKYDDVLLAKFTARLQSILDIRVRFEQLCQDLTRHEMLEMRVAGKWTAFEGIAPFNVETDEDAWNSAVTDFHRRLEPLELRVASNLRTRLQSCAGNTQMLLQEFTRMVDLMALCPRIRGELSSERDTLLAKLSEKVQSMRQDFDAKSQRPDTDATWEDDQRRQAGKYMPAVINRLIWARQIRFKVQQVHSYSHAILKDLNRADRFSDLCEKLIADVSDFERETFNNWVFDIRDRISGRGSAGALTVHTSGALTDLDKEGKLQVNYSAKLVELTKECRQFSAYGFKVPSDISTVAQQAMQLFRQAVILRQVANVYNNLASDIIPCTRQMLLDNAVRFENIVAPKVDKKRITWNNAIEAEGHVRRLQSASESLTTESRRIRSVHQDLANRVIDLMNIDLVKTPDKWQRKFNEMRYRLSYLARDNDYKFEDMERWLRHWDYQLYKALEYQYQVGLENLNENMPDIRVDLTFRDGKIQFKPPLEEIRSVYYSKLFEYISYPRRFVGVGRNSDLFAQMISFNDKSLFSVYQKAQELFTKVNKLKRKFRDQVILGMCGHDTANLEEFIEKSLTDVQHWELNFRTLKQKGKELSTIDNVIKVDCIAVSVLPLKSAIEEQLSVLGTLLISSLRRSATANLEKIDAFLATAASVIDTQATTLEDITRANKLFAEMSQQKPGMESEIQRFDAKNRLLRSVSGNMIDSTEVMEKWDTFVNALDSHEKIMESHLAKMKAAVDTAIQKHLKDVEKFAAHWHELKPKDVKSFRSKEDIIEKAIKFVRERSTAFEALKKQGTDIVAQCEYFKMDTPDKLVTLTEELDADVTATQTMWGLFEEFDKDSESMRAELWFSMRSKLYRFEDFIKEWIDKLREKEANDVVLHLRNILDEWNQLSPMLKLLRGEGMTPEHWQELFTLMSLDRNTNPDTLTFGQIIDRHTMILQNEKKIRGLHARVLGELQLREALHDVRSWARDATFTLVQTDAVRVRLITDWKDLVTAVSDNQSLLGSLKDSPYFAPFADEATKWEHKFVLLDEYLHSLNQIQRKWVYLEPIFARGALPQEQPRFKRVDKDFVGIMEEINSDPHVMVLAEKDYRDRLKQMLEQLERCQKALNEFLESKRDRFPRFYFIGDDDLLEILGQSQNPTVIQSHLKKLFMGINVVTFDKEQKNILNIVSLDGEVVPLNNSVQIRVEVEDWLNDLDKEMRSTLTSMLNQCINETNLIKYPSQILSLAEMITFTQLAEEHIKKRDFKNLRAYLTKQLRDNTSFQSDGDIVSELKMKSLILDVIHHLDIVEQLVTAKVEKESDWTWQKQLRFYNNASTSNECIVRMANAKFRYTYEYQGNAPKLVYTPLTDKCYLTLTQGMHLGYGGNPYGPAGTGKTESVKALGNALGRQVLVFNCDEGIDFKSMGRIFIGLVKCGSWGCFDEFNRLKVDQLSAISQMIQVIQEALKQNEQTCELLERTIQVNQNAGIFVTLNPAGKGYGGRSKLPDNLKQLFRAVAMTVPDNELIAETILYSEGFENGKALAKKLVAVFRLCKQLLSQQQHYDWGLRPLKAVLRLGGTLVQQRRKERIANNEEGDVLQEESEIIIKSLNVNTLSKLTFDDARLFQALIKDVFPGVEVKEIVYEKLRPAIEHAIEELKLQVLENQIQKVLQLYEALRQRMGVVLVGPSGSGKSTLLKILRKALQKLGTTVPMYVMNPKAMPRQQLLGHMDLDTREWYDGVLTSAARKVVKESTDVLSWILCDGDIDPEWVESLNSVLDDNKLLTMPNGVRIQFGSNVNFVFETHSLQFASPATVSRMGIIFLSEEDVSPSVVVTSWLAEQAPEVRERIQPWIEEYFGPAIDEAITTQSLCVDTTRMGLVMSGLSHLREVTTKAEFAIALIRGIGCYVMLPQREDYARDVFNLVGERPADTRRPLDCFFDANRMSMQPYVYESGGSDLTIEDLHQTPMIRTIDVQRNLDNLGPWLGTHYRPFILVGPEGCGKTMLLKNAFNSIKGARVTIINCNAQTVAAHVIQKLTQMCSVFSTNQGRVLRPREGDRLILFLKDLSLPKPDHYGTVQLHSFLQQLVLYQGFYDKDLEWVGVERVQIVASMNPVGGVGRHPVSSRFIAIVSVMYMSYPNKTDMESIYGEIMYTLLNAPPLNKNPTWGGGKGAAELAKVLTGVYEQVQRKYNVDNHSHYIFTPRDVTTWALNLTLYDTDNADMLDVVAYEAHRVFSDRLVTMEERSQFDGMLMTQLTPLYYGKPPSEDRKGKVFVTWLSDKSRRLMTITTKDFKRAMDDAVKSYQRTVQDLTMNIIPETLQWTARADRVLSQPGGHLLFVGRSGVGRRAVVTLACFQLGIALKTLNMSLSYDQRSFRADLREVIMKAGIENSSVALLLEDHNIVDTSFLEMVNSLIASGEVPGLFTHEELEPMLGPIKEDALQEGFMGSTYDYFVTRVQRNLHIIVLMDNRSASYELRCQSNPALFTRCQVAWMGTWTTDGMRILPRSILNDIVKQLEENKDTFDLRAEFVAMHQGMGTEVSPQQFLSLMRTYRSLFNEKSLSFNDSIKRLQSGLSKLEEAESAVAQIRVDVTSKKADLEVKQKEADEALNEIQKKMGEASVVKEKIQAHQKLLDQEQDRIQLQKGDIDKQLSQVQPMIDEARAAIGKIKSENLNEIRSFNTPPDAIRDVLEGVLMMLGSHDTSWPAMKKFLGQRGIKDQILNFNARELSPEVRDAVGKILETKATSYKHEVIARANVAAAPMAAWVKANVAYSRVVDRITPLEAQAKAMVDKLDKGKRDLEKGNEKLRKIDSKVEELKKSFQRRTQEAETLRERLEKAQATLDAAEELLGKLGNEKSRWSHQVSTIQKDLKSLPKLALLAAGFIAYLGKESESVRERIVGEWKDKLSIDSFRFPTYLRTESQLLEYKSEGLPGDELSLENAVTILSTTEVPLVIDPANQAVEWLKAYLKRQQKTVEVCTVHDERFMTTLELAIRFGKTLLICEVDKIEPTLYPIIRKELNSDGPKKVVQLGDRAVDWAESFQLFLFTRDSYISLPPDAQSLVTTVNFSITHNGLEAQLLGLTIQHEQPELEEEKLKLLHDEESLKMQLSELEESLLRELASSQGSLLENKSLVDSLNQIKTQAMEIGKALERSHELQLDLDTKRNVFQPFAKLGSSMFFLIRDMTNVSPMYKYSLGMFLDIFHVSLEESKANSPTTMADKIKDLSRLMAQKAFLFVTRGLFKEHRLLFGMHVVKGLFPDICNQTEWDLFVRKVPLTHVDSSDVPRWVDADSASSFGMLRTLLPALVGDLKVHETDTWYRWMRSPSPEMELPAPVAKLTPFQQLIVVQTFRSDRLAYAMSSFVCSKLDVQALSEVGSLGHIAKEAKASEPILLLTTPGADPSMEVQDVAHSVIGKANFYQVALGGGQTDGAMQLVRKCAKEGGWVFLKNLHLVIGWAAVLEKEINTMQPHKDFRLWLTSETHDAFPAILLSSSLKITFEAPPGVKQNLLRTYDGWSPSFIGAKSQPQASTLFVLAWFHSIVQERRNYIPQGWTKFYEFSQADLRSAADVIAEQFRNDQPDWHTIRGILYNAIYGGRMDNDYDAKVLETYLANYFCDESTGVNKGRLRPLARGVQTPQTKEHKDYNALIQTLPGSDVPATFFMPPNAERVVQRVRVAKVLADLMKLREATSVAHMGKEEWANRLQPILTLWTSLCTPHADALAFKSSKSKDKRPVEGFVQAELDNALSLVQAVENTMECLRKVIEGTMLLSAQLSDQAANMIAGDVPFAWSTAFAGPEEIIPWLRTLVHKAVAIHSWNTRATAGTLLREKLHLSDLFRPHTFLNALRQQTARQTGEALVDLVLACSWGKPLPSCVLPIVIESMYLQGATIDESGTLAEVSADGVALLGMPDCHVGWVIQDSKKDLDACVVGLPVYVNQTREILLVELDVPCQSSDKDKWVLSSVAIILEQS
eukprot:PhM_4_TR16775/c0_g1_i1/m.22691/K10414/DYNC2H, DNCH2; dynein heavy chain 2, cytosolic